jgi:hypothetical protein
MVGPSKILERRWKEREALIHKSKISNAKSNIRKHQALSVGVLNQTNLKFNAKKESVKEGKLSFIHLFYFCFSYRAIYPNREGK